MNLDKLGFSVPRKCILANYFPLMNSFKKLFHFIFHITILGLFLFSNDSLIAKDNNRAFDSLKIGLKFLKNTNHNIFHDIWKPNTGVEGFIETPFYFGTIQAGIQFMSFTSELETIPNFQSFLYYIQWGKMIETPFKINWTNSVRFGSYAMRIDETHFPNSLGIITENELAVGLDSQLDYSYLNNWSLNLSTTYLVVYTHKRIKLLFVSLGFTRSFRTPTWLKEFLK